MHRLPSLRQAAWLLLALTLAACGSVATIVSTTRFMFGKREMSRSGRSARNERTARSQLSVLPFANSSIIETTTMRKSSWFHPSLMYSTQPL